MKRAFFSLYIILFSAATLHAQDAGGAFQFLQLPISSHAAALGGDNTSIIEDDATLAFHNPALLSNAYRRTLSLNYMSYLQKTNIASAAYNMEAGDRSMLAFGAHYLNYGSMKNTDPEGNIIGNFTAKDMALMTAYSFDFSNRLSGGVTGKFIYSNYEHVYSLALGVEIMISLPSFTGYTQEATRPLAPLTSTRQTRQEPLLHSPWLNAHREGIS